MTQADYAHRDRITLTGITAKGYHGVLDFEKPFVVDATLYSDFSAAAATDDLTKTTNYALVVDLIHRHVTNGSLDLIETLAVNIAEGILAMFELVEAAEITVSKPPAPIELPFGNVAVSVFRERAAERVVEGGR